MRKATVHTHINTEYGYEERHIHFDELEHVHTYLGEGTNYIFCSRFSDGTWHIGIGGVKLNDVTDKDVDNLMSQLEKERENIEP